MDNSLFVGCRQAMRNLYREVYRFARRQRTGGQTIAKRGPFEKFRHQIGRTLMGTDVVNREKVGMVECTRRTRLLLEAAKTVEIAAVGSGQYLDRNFAA